MPPSAGHLNDAGACLPPGVHSGRELAFPGRRK